MTASEWWEVRRLSQQGVSQREIAVRLGINRRTVARMAAAPAPPPQAPGSRGSQLDPLMETIARALVEQPRIRAPQLTRLLRAEHGYAGSVDLVRRRLAEVRAEKQGAAPPSGPRPGALIEWDWAEMATRPSIGGVNRSVWALVASLPFSGAQTAHFTLDATLESFLEGHVRVFDWLGGVPEESAYDHLLPVVAKRDSRLAMRWNKRFRALRSHYEFDTSAYTSPATPWTPELDDSLKEAVERIRNSFWPALAFKGLSELDGVYATWRDERTGAHREEAGSDPALAERLGEERAGLRALPQEGFDFSVRRAVRVSADGYVRHGACFYRAPGEFANRRVELHASRDEVWIVVAGRRVARYPRSYTPGMWLPGPPL